MSAGASVQPTRLVYFAPSDLQVPRVDRHCIVRFCEALVEAGCPVELVSLKIRLEFDEPTKHKPLNDVYAIRTPFPIHLLRSGLRQESRNSAIGVARLIRYSAFAARYAASLDRGDELIFYFKNPRLIEPLSLVRATSRRRIQLVMELHALPNARIRRALLRSVDFIVSNHPQLTADTLELEPLLAPKIESFHQGVDVATLDARRMPQPAARHELGLPVDARLVVYTGKVNTEWREIDCLLEAAKHFDRQTKLVIVGGREDQIPPLRDRLVEANRDRVMFTGFVEPSRAQLYQLAADILVTYYTYDKPLLEYVSPGKLFEYMAARRPIVSADHPALRDVLTDDHAAFVAPEHPRELAAAVRRLLADPAERARLAHNAFELAQSYTWRARADRFLDELAGRSLIPKHGVSPAPA